MKTIIVNEDLDGVRLDRLLKKEMKKVPLSLLFRHLRKGNIKVNGKKKKQDFRLSAGDEVKLFIKKEELFQENEIRKYASVNSTFFKKNFHVLYEDDSILVCNKPSGLVVHPGTGHSERNTLVYLANSYMSQKNMGEISLVHRLDRDTSGIILLAKNKKTLRSLNAQLKGHEMEKKYTALCHGVFKEKRGVIDLELKKESRQNSGMKMKVEKGGVRSLSNFRVTSGKRNFSRVEVEIHTGKTHQIRVHMNYLGHPIIGDRRYGNCDLDKKLLSSDNPRLYLHAESISFNHPEYNRKVSFNAPLPEEFIKLLKLKT